ncbi:glycoside-pentoside-hexuronide (GPH):cation symporter [Desertibacillus haloalkaliphilus]|uniref:glycoside-pentoside-hexuronide (GPH):cation symporter n=1 Tax=Desertibacillus haloalkaliphilus TaxID=1328930 RepID=UPI001C2681BE|nr:glycoside-pentoside-hexuronide (GPH):cation symporter [Desertibacillus haloalkaliphilus]MBU8906522.1 glycoside-pentoside-hexuronide (GPH):cation symporter [Desertibacillus haloalkaliphilus]
MGEPKITNDMTENNNTANEKLPFKEKLSYGLGDAANNLTFAMVSTYLMVFYTDVFGIGAAAVGLLFLLARVFDAINDPIMGGLIDKYSKNGPKGRFRPFMKWAGFPVAILGVFIFMSPDLSDGGKLAYAYITYILFGMAYTAVNIPYGSLAASMTRDPVQRSSLASFRGFGSMVGSFIIGVVVLPLVALFPTREIGFPAVAAMLGVIAIFFYYLTYRNTKERIVVKESSRLQKVDKEMVLRILKSGPFLALSAMSFFILLTLLINQAVGVYYFTHYLENEMLFPVYNLINIATILILIPLIPVLSRKIGKKSLALYSFALGAIAMFIVFFLPDNPWLIMIGLVIGMKGILIPNILVWAFISDVIDYGEWKEGVRQEGTTYSLYSFMRKLSQAIAGWAGATGLVIIGYVPNVAQSAETLFGLQSMMVLFPAIACIICLLIFKFGYKLDDDRMVEIATDLDKR